MSEKHDSAHIAAWNPQGGGPGLSRCGKWKAAIRKGKFFMLDKARVMLMAEQEAAVIDGTATPAVPSSARSTSAASRAAGRWPPCTVRKRTCHSRPCAG